MSGNETFDSPPIIDAIAALEAETPPDPEPAVEGETPPVEAAPVEAEAPPAVESRADKVRAEALRRKAEREARVPVADPPPRERAPSPLEEFQAEEIRRSVEFARLFQRNPHEAAKRAGMDPLKVAQLFIKEGQQPGTLASEEQQGSVMSELKALRERLEQRDQADAQARQMQAQQAEAARLVDQFKVLAGDTESYPLLSGLDDGARMEEAAIAEQRYHREYGHWPTMAEVAELVEDKLEKYSRLGGGQSNGASKGAATKKVNQVTRGASRRTAGITNDLAAETAASVDLDMSDHAVMKRAALALQRVGAE